MAQDRGRDIPFFDAGPLVINRENVGAAYVEINHLDGMLAGGELDVAPSLLAAVDAIVVDHLLAPDIKSRSIICLGKEPVLARLFDLDQPRIDKGHVGIPVLGGQSKPVNSPTLLWQQLLDISDPGLPSRMIILVAEAGQRLGLFTIALQLFAKKIDGDRGGLRPVQVQRRHPP